MRLALLSPIHGQSIDHIARQLENYRTFLTPFKLRHFLHLSLESSASLQHELLDYADQHGHDIVFTQHRRRTWRHCTANALKELISCASIHPESHHSFFIHTDSDLLFSPKVKKIIRSRRIACGSKALNPKSKWKWNGPAQQDPRLKAFACDYADNNFRNLYKGRVCGCSLPQKTFLQFSEIYLKYFNLDYIESNPGSEWPLAEIAIPSILRLAIDPSPKPFHPALISAPKTKTITVNSIKQALRKKSSYGMKKIARDTQSEAFTFLMDLQVKAQNKHALNASPR